MKKNEEPISEFNYDKIRTMIDNFSPDRAKEYASWYECVFTIIGMCKRSNINKTNCCNLIHFFSKKYPDKYDEYKVDNWIDNNYNNAMNTEKSYGFKQALNYLKIDNKKYYNMFKGFRAQHLPVCKDYTKIEKNLNHLKEVIANDNDVFVYKYILQWIKKILNGIRTNVMIMLKGKQVIGKNIFINMA